MKIAINTLPLSSGHKNRGIGIYTKNLIENITKFDKENHYVFFENVNELKSVDLIHYPFFDPFFLTLPINKPFPTIVTVHDLTPIIFSKDYPRGIKGEIKWKIQKYSLKSSAHVITDSDNSKKDIKKILNISPDKISVVYLAVSENFKLLDKGDWISEIKNKYHLKNDFVLYVGDVNYNKNIPGLFKAFSRVEKKDLDLVLVGAAFENPAVFDKSQVPQNSKILGYIPEEDLIKLYNLAKLLCLPSFYEGFGLPVLEALSCGCQVVASDNSSLPEIGGEAVFYCDPENPHNIALKITEAINQPKDKKTLISQARSFSWEKTALETIKVYEKALL